MTRILSWQQQVEVCDPNWLQGYTRPWWYEFSNGRRFLWDAIQAYGNFSIDDSIGLENDTGAIELESGLGSIALETNPPVNLIELESGQGYIANESGIGGIETENNP